MDNLGCFKMEKWMSKTCNRSKWLNWIESQSFGRVWGICRDNFLLRKSEIDNSKQLQNCINNERSITYSFFKKENISSNSEYTQKVSKCEIYYRLKPLFYLEHIRSSFQGCSALGKHIILNCNYERSLLKKLTFTFEDQSVEGTENQDSPFYQFLLREWCWQHKNFAKELLRTGLTNLENLCEDSRSYHSNLMPV